MRVLGVDLGERKTGLALSDPLGVSCSPLEVIEERDRERLLLKIMEIAEEQDVGEIVVGLPRPLRGGTNAHLTSTLAFVELLEKRVGARVATWDERFTTKLAERGSSSMRPRDAVAACYMLQDYLESRPGNQGDR